MNEILLYKQYNDTIFLVKLQTIKTIYNNLWAWPIYNRNIFIQEINKEVIYVIINDRSNLLVVSSNNLEEIYEKFSIIRKHSGKWYELWTHLH